MANFNRMTEAEKFSATKDMLRIRDLVAALRPDLTPAARDIIIARRLSSEIGSTVDAAYIGQCRNFAAAKTGNPDCSKLDFDIKKEEYRTQMDSETQTKDDLHQQAKREMAQKTSDFNKKHEAANKAKSRLGGAKFMLWSAVGLVGITAVNSLSTIVGTITGFLLGPQAITFAIFAIAVAVGFKMFWPAIKARYKNSMDSLNKKAKDTAELAKAAEDELCTQRTAEIAAEQELNDTKNKNRKEEDELSRNYKNNSELEDRMSMAINEVVVDAQNKVAACAVDAYTAARVKNINELRDYHVCMIHYDVMNGRITTQAELDGKVNNAKTDFHARFSEVFPLPDALDPTQKTAMTNAQNAEGVR